MTPLRSMLVLLFLFACVLLAAGCAGKTPEKIKTADIQIPIDGKKLPVFTTPAIPQDKYVFVEHRINTDGENITVDCCPMEHADFQSYYFDRKKETLGLSLFSGGTVNESLKMIYGDGVSLSGCAGTGGSTEAFPVYSLPFTPRAYKTTQNVTIETVSGDGTVSIHYEQERISLKPKETWSVNTTYIETRKLNPECTIRYVTTDSIYNSGFLNKSKISVDGMFSI